MENVKKIWVELQAWGAYWRNQENKGLGYPAIGPGQQLIELARLGCRVQKTTKHDQSGNINVPWRYARIDAVVETLPENQRAALREVYVKNPKIPRRKVQESRALLRAEMTILHSL